MVAIENGGYFAVALVGTQDMPRLRKTKYQSVGRTLPNLMVNNFGFDTMEIP
ncbi:hypothetical protein DGWBC_1179 [Dehalogenimonas sp. WBC-2]|nr:hypothetical protein DGWBC_1179 [Dehalogenimonas sp. WBC-2]